MRKKDITGQKFGRLTAQWPVGTKCGAVCWLCVCECGQLKIIQAGNLARTQSCGCLRKDLNVDRGTHGHSRGGRTSSEYSSFSGAKNRCCNSNNPAYANYGGRGIEFRFKNFEEFFNELGEKPKPKQYYSLDRINSDSHYEKGNVRWTTVKIQNQNRRKFSTITRFTTDELLKELNRRGVR